MLQPKFLGQFMLLSAFTVVASTKAMIAVDAQAQRHMRSLSAEETRTDRFEERMFSNVLSKDASMVENVAPTLRSTLSSDKEKEVVNHLFEKFHKTSVETNLFASKQYQNWASNVLGAHKDSTEAYDALFRELKTHYDDYELALFIRHGLASSETKDVATKYQILQMNDWVANRIQAHDVFRALHLDYNEGNVFKNPLLETFYSFARQLPQRPYFMDRLIYERMVTTLKQKLGLVRLVEMLGATNVDLSDGSIGNRVMKALFIDEMSKKTYRHLIYVTSVFTDHAVEGSAAVSVWLSSAESFLTKDEYNEYVTRMLNSYWIKRGRKVKALVTVIAAAQESESSRRAASNTLEKLFVEWEEQRTSTSDVLTILDLDLAEMRAEDMTEGPLLETWYLFVARRHATEAALLKALQSHLTEEQLATLINIKTAKPHLQARAYFLNLELFNNWATEGVDVDKAFVRLRLHNAGDKLFTHPALKVWLSYASHRGSPTPGALLTQVVRKYFTDSKSLLDMVNRELEKKDFSSGHTLAETLKQNWSGSSS